MSLFGKIAGGALGALTGGGGAPGAPSGPSNAQSGPLSQNANASFGGIGPVAIGGFKSDGSGVVVGGSSIWKWVGIAAAVLAAGYAIGKLGKR